MLRFDVVCLLSLHKVRTLGPLTSCEEVGSEERVNMFMELVDGVFLHKIMTQM